MITITKEWQFETIGASINKAIYSIDGAQIITVGGKPGQIWIWNATDRNRIAVLSSQESFISFLNTWGQIAVVSGNSTDSIELWDLQTQRLLQRICILPKPYLKSIAGHYLDSTHVTSSAITKDGCHLAVGCWDCTAKVVDLQNEKVTVLAEPHRNNVDTVGFFDDDRLLITGTWRALFVWETATWKCLRTIRLGGDKVWNHIMIPEDNTIVSLSEKGTICIWNASTWLFDEYNLGTIGTPSCMAYSTQNKLLAVGYQKPVVSFWSLNARHALGKVKLANGRIWSLSFAPCRQALLIHSDDLAKELFEVEYSILE